MNSVEDKEAKILYGNSDYNVLSYGGYVLCAVTGYKIPLKELCYWHVDRQEAYCNAQAALERHLSLQKASKK